MSPSESFAAIAVAFCVGILVGPVFVFGHHVVSSYDTTALFEVLLAAAIILSALAAVFRSRKFRFVLFLVAAFLFGVSRYGQAFFPDHVLTVQDRVGPSIRVSGVVSGEVEQRVGSQRIVLDHVRVADDPAEGKVLVRFDMYPEISTGDSLVFTCRLEQPEPFASFRYDRYLASKGILATCPFPQNLDVRPAETRGLVGSVLEGKKAVVKKLQSIVPEPHASFLSGLLFGGSSSLSQDLKDSFSRTGTSHILAASGFNVSLFTVFFLGWILGTRLKRKQALGAVALVLFIYVIMAGASPAVVRAAIMASLLLVGKLVSRRASMRNVLLFTAAIMLLVNPLILLDDVGFQLSFVATIGLLFVAPRLDHLFPFLPKLFGIRESFIASLVAIVLTLPIVLWHFASVSLVAPIINLLILPIIPFLMAIMFIALGIAFVSQSLGTFAAIPGWAISSLILHVIGWFSALPYAQVESEYAPVASIVSAVMIVLVYLFSRRRYALAHLST